MTLPSILTRGVQEVLPTPEGLVQVMAKKKIKVFLGIDPTGAFLTLGHSVAMRKLQQFADAGHDAILLIGNGTVKIGDPTGRDTTRPVLTDELIEANFKDWQRQASKVLDFSKIRLVHNGDWLDKLTYTDMVKLLAQTTVQQLTERDMFQDRIKKGLPIFGHEIIYPLLQGYDSVAMDVDLEIGGSDQTFNMMMGRQLQKSYNGHEKWVLSTPIINGTDGRKMSKSYGNYVAITEPANDMYGKLMSIADHQIIEYFTLLTDVSETEIQEMAQAIKQGENPMTAKKKLAHTITTMYHSSDEARQAADHFAKTVQNKEAPETAEAVHFSAKNILLLDVLKTCLPDESANDLKRLIQQGAVELMPSGEKPTDLQMSIDLSAVQTIRAGKRRYFKIVVK